MQNPHFHRAVLAGLLSALALPLSASAQSRVDNSGATDANNQVGSSGRNDYGVTRTVQPTGNQIIYGNVTGGRAFQGPIPYTDPRAFRGTTAGQVSDRFIRDASGSPGQATAFYGASRAVPAPTGFAREGFTGGYVPPGAVASQVAPPSYSPSMNFDPAIAGRVLSAPPRQSEMVLPGPLDPTTLQPTMITGSPLYGIRQWKVGDPIDEYYLKSQSSFGAEDLLRRAQIEPDRFQKMQQELEDKNNIAKPMGKPMESPDNKVIGGSSMNKPLESGSIDGGMGTDQTLRHRLLLPEQQSAQYAKLRGRLESFYEERGKTDADFNREFQEQRRAAKENRSPLTPKLPKPEPTPTPPSVTPRVTPTPSPTPSPTPVAPSPATKPVPVVPRPDPVDITTLTKGVDAKGLAEILGAAEEMMKQGKFNSALDQYAAAGRLAPNNALVTLGKAHAQLGAQYYNRADSTLRQAISTDGALLMGRYDLKAFYGEKRLNEVIADLKALSAQNAESAQPVFLLAYVAYNTGDGQMAANWLAEADRRADGKDPMIKVFRDHWKLPEANK